MKTESITVNKTADNPKGIDLEIVKPQSTVEQRLLSHMLVPYIRAAKERGNLPYDLPDNFTVEYLREGTFLASAQGPRASQGYYEPAKPIAIFGGRTFDLIHAEAARRADAKKDDQNAAEAKGTMETETADESPEHSDAPEGAEASEAKSES